MSTPSESRPMRPFLALWSAQALSLVGSQAVQFALIWWLTRTTGSATVLALAALAGLLPPVLLGPIAGALVDRTRRKRVMLLADAFVAVVSGVVAVLFAAGIATVPLVFAALVARAFGATFHGPAMTASTSLMVPERHLARVQGFNQMLQGGSLIVSAPLGGLLLAILPMAGVLAVDVVTAAIAIAVLAFVRVPQPPRDASSVETDANAVSVATTPATGTTESAVPTEVAASSAKPSLWADIVAGLRYLAARPGHRFVIAIAAVTNLFVVPAFSLLPLLVFERLGGSALQLAGMQSAFGVGMLGGGIALGVWGGFRRRIVTTLVGMFLFAGAVLALGLAPGIAFATAAMFAVGCLVPLVNGPLEAVLQATVEPSYQGRVFTLVTSLAGISAPLGLALAAPVAEVFGVRAWYVAGAVAAVAMAAFGLRSRAVLRIEDDAPGATPTPETAPAAAEGTAEAVGGG